MFALTASRAAEFPLNDTYAAKLTGHPHPTPVRRKAADAPQPDTSMRPIRSIASHTFDCMLEDKFSDNIFLLDGKIITRNLRRHGRQCAIESIQSFVYVFVSMGERNVELVVALQDPARQQLRIKALAHFVVGAERTPVIINFS